MRTIEFIKMHGLGNDFVIIDKNHLPSSFDFKKDVAILSSRHTGIGCDQFILYDVKENGDISMSIYNSNGSEAEVCGNATRCLIKLLSQKLQKETFTIFAAGRKILGRVTDGIYEVNMGEASFNESWMPDLTSFAEIAEDFKIELKDIICVDVGNPHLVIFSPLLSDSDRAFLGAKLEKHKIFPYGVNVNFAKVNNNHIQLKVWERGVGFTLACGSGACATFAGAKKLGFATDQATVSFSLGELVMRSHNKDIIMQGGATLVYTGSYLYES